MTILAKINTRICWTKVLLYFRLSTLNPLLYLLCVEATFDGHNPVSGSFIFGFIQFIYGHHCGMEPGDQRFQFIFSRYYPMMTGVKGKSIWPSERSELSVSARLSKCSFIYLNVGTSYTSYFFIILVKYVGFILFLGFHRFRDCKSIFPLKGKLYVLHLPVKFFNIWQKQYLLLKFWQIRLNAKLVLSQKVVKISMSRREIVSYWTRNNFVKKLRY